MDGVSGEVDFGGGYTGWGGVATVGLVCCEAEMAAFAESAKALTPVEVSNRMAQFARSFVGYSFEIRRRAAPRGDLARSFGDIPSHSNT